MSPTRRWSKKVCLALGTVAWLASAKPSVAESGGEVPPQRFGSGNPAIGKQKADAERCLECHGTDGNSGDTRIPNHSGQYAGYLIKQLSDFQSGARTHATMSIMAADLSDEDKADIAAYFAGLERGGGEAGPGNAIAQKLFANGDPARNLPSCASCHGDNGKGRVADNVIYPLIAGQRKVYLRTQLVNWKLGERKNSPQGVMNQVAKVLSDEEIDALTDYLSRSK